MTGQTGRQAGRLEGWQGDRRAEGWQDGWTAGRLDGWTAGGQRAEGRAQLYGDQIRIKLIALALSIRYQSGINYSAYAEFAEYTPYTARIRRVLVFHGRYGHFCQTPEFGQYTPSSGCLVFSQWLKLAVFCWSKIAKTPRDGVYCPNLRTLLQDVPNTQNVTIFVTFLWIKLFFHNFPPKSTFQKPPPNTP